jgi:hypothetical protein
LWEIKTAEYSNDGKYNEFTRKIEYNNIVNDAITESSIAKSCGKKYVLGVTDKGLFNKLELLPNLWTANSSLKLVK